MSIALELLRAYEVAEVVVDEDIWQRYEIGDDDGEARKALVRQLERRGYRKEANIIRRRG